MTAGAHKVDEDAGKEMGHVLGTNMTITELDLYGEHLWCIMRMESFQLSTWSGRQSAWN